jgi:ribosomal protein L34E
MFADLNRTGKEHSTQNQPNEKEDHPRIEKEPTGAIKQKEPKMTPTITPCTQMGSSASTVGRQRCRDFNNVEFVESCLHNHFTGELHASCSQIELEDCLTAKPTQSTMEILYGATKENSTDCRKHRVPEVPVKSRHRSGFDTTRKPVSHDEVGSATKCLDERPKVGEVVTVVGIAHDDELAFGIGNTGRESSAITTNRDIDDTRAFGTGNVLRTVRTAVVSDHNLSVDAQTCNRGFGFTDTHRKRFRLVETWENDSEFHGPDTTQAIPSIDETELLTDGMVIEIVRTPLNSMTCVQFPNHRAIDRDQFARTSTITDRFTLSSSHRVLNNKAFPEVFGTGPLILPNQKMKIRIPAQGAVDHCSQFLCTLIGRTGSHPMNAIIGVQTNDRVCIMGIPRIGPDFCEHWVHRRSSKQKGVQKQLVGRVGIEPTTKGL